MARISNEAKNRYAQRITAYKKTVEGLLKQEAAVLNTLNDGAETIPYKKIDLAEKMLDLVSYYVLMNSTSAFLLGVKNEAYLNAARKACYKSIIYLEDTLSSLIDVPFSDYEGKLAAIEKYEDPKRFALLNKLGFSIQAIIDGFGENTKWKWAFVELEGRFATVAKNFLDLKNLLAGLDPRSPGYAARTAHLNLVKKLLQTSADKYRQKYELSTHRIDDFKIAIDFLGGLRRLHVLIGEVNEAQDMKKKIDIWRSKMETDSKKLEQGTRTERVTKTSG
ncbi:MAG: hypothetical protein JW852_04070 [Spirochaetales bacterium]|nr:hypothetical protein [Spirochaetales bacterium]